MSHFTVLVVTENPEQLKGVLQPYHEYECTGIYDEYVKFIECEESLDELKAEHKRHLKEYADSTPEDFVQFIDGWYGYILQGGKWGKITNPDAKWDWWQIGGRWSGFFDLKQGASGVMGEQSLLAIMQNGGKAIDTKEKVDQARKIDIDFEGMMSEAAIDAAKKYDSVTEIICGRAFLTWEETRESHDDIETARKAYREQGVIIDFRDKFDNPFTSVDEYKQDRESYIKSKSLASISTFAVLYNGEWKEKGKMGWWACVSNENESWQGDYLELLSSIPDDAYLTIVDCHI